MLGVGPGDATYYETGWPLACITTASGLITRPLAAPAAGGSRWERLKSSTLSRGKWRALVIPQKYADRVDISWSAATNAVSYTLERSSQPDFSTTTTVYQGENTSFSDSVTTEGVYYYRVRPADNCLPGEWREGGAVSVDILEPPSSFYCPSVDYDGSFNVHWGAGGSGLVGYTLQRATDEAFSDAVTVGGGDPMATSYQESGLTDGVYYYRVRAEYDCPGSSDWRTRAPVTVIHTPPGEVDSISYPSQACTTDGGVPISWSAASNVTGYRLERATSGDFADAEYVYGGIHAYYTDSVTDVGVYYYRVRARNDLGYSAWREGGPVSVYIMAAPSAISYPSADYDGSFLITWQPVGSGLVSYTLQRATNTSFSDAVVVNGGADPTATAYLESGLAAGVYYYRVRANYECPGSSDWAAGGSIVVSSDFSSLAQIDIAHSSPSDLVVELGTGDPQNPVWHTLVWNRQYDGGVGQLQLDVNLSAAASHLPPSPDSPWYVKVYDDAAGEQGTITSFSITHDGHRYVSHTVPVSITDHNTSYAYIDGLASNRVAGAIELLLREFKIPPLFGLWVLTVSYTCSDPWYYISAVLYDDYTLSAADGAWRGTWSLTANAFTAVLDDGTKFTGITNGAGTLISGHMVDTGGAVGCWAAAKLSDQ